MNRKAADSDYARAGESSSNIWQNTYFSNSGKGRLWCCLGWSGKKVRNGFGACYPALSSPRLPLFERADRKQEKQEERTNSSERSNRVYIKLRIKKSTGNWNLSRFLRRSGKHFRARVYFLTFSWARAGKDNSVYTGDHPGSMHLTSLWTNF